MRIYPAIDILGGKAVRLKRGRKAEATVYGDPLAMATKWVSKGADWLHVVDLVGSFLGQLYILDLLLGWSEAVGPAKARTWRSLGTVECSKSQTSVASQN